MSVHGWVKPGFESVKELFSEGVRRGTEYSAQLCVYVGEERVIDLWGSSSSEAHDTDYTADSLQTVFSSGKTLAAIAIACLVNRGYIDYDTKISDIWPEFGTLDVEGGTRLKDVLRHEAGLVLLSDTVTWDKTQRDGIKSNAMGELIEKAERVFPPSHFGSKREYHSVTRGWILNEIFRRVDPQKRTIGEFLRQEIADPLNADVHIGLQERDFARVVDLKVWGMPYVFFQSLIPKNWGRKIEPSFADFYAIISFMYSLGGKDKKNEDKPQEEKRYKKKPPKLIDMTSSMTGIFVEFNKEEVRTGETPSAGAICSARGLARVAACMAQKGKLADVRLLSEETVDAMHKEPTPAKMYKMPGFVSNFSQGGVNFYKMHESMTPPERFRGTILREGFVGWQGLGGSVMQWHPQLKIGFGFARNLMHWYDFQNLTGATLQAEVVKCLKEVNGMKSSL